MRYKYRQIRSVENPDDTFLEPIIPVALRYGGGRTSTFALIDSGAQLCLFHSSIAKVLGIDLRSGREVSIKSLSPYMIPAYIHKVHLVLQNEPGVDIEIGFIEADLIADGGILGQLGFFDEFDVRFQRWQNSIWITRKTGWRPR